MTTVEDRLREAAAQLTRSEDSVPPFQSVQRRVRRRRLIRLSCIVVGLIAATSVSLVTRAGKDRILVANPGSTSAGATATTATAKISIVENGNAAHHDYPYDLIGDARPIPVDHLGRYTWTSAVVVRFVPDAWNWSYRAGGTGTAQITSPRDTLAQVPGGYSLRVTFTVISFTGSPTLQMISHANGPAPKVPPNGLVVAPNVLGMTRSQAMNVLNRVHLGVLVAGTAQMAVVVGQSPMPFTTIRENGVVTLTLGPRPGAQP